MFSGNLRGELNDFVEAFGELTIKKFKLGRDPHVDAPLRQILKHQTEVDDYPWWLLRVSFLCDNLYLNK